MSSHDSPHASSSTHPPEEVEDEDENEESRSFYVQALYAYSGVDTSSLSFRPGDVIEVLSTLSSGWWDGVLCEQKVRGWFPSNYVQRLDEEEARWAKKRMIGWWGGEGEEDGEEEPGRASNEFMGGVVAGPNAFEGLLKDGDTNYSDGGNIFSEIAEAARAEAANPTNGAVDRRRSVYTTASDQDDEDRDDDNGDDDEDEEDYWVPKVTHRGQLFYYNSSTGETSRDMPIDGRGDGVRIDPNEFDLDEDERFALMNRPSGSGSGPQQEEMRRGAMEDWNGSWEPTPGPSVSAARMRGSTGDASLLSAWTERPGYIVDDRKSGSFDHADTLRPVSVYSQDSRNASKNDLSDKGKAVEQSGKASSSPAAAAIGQLEGAMEKTSVDENEKRRSTKSSRRAPRRSVSTAQLLAPSPPPLLCDLEATVTIALQRLIDIVGVHGIVGRRSSTATIDATTERETLAQHGDGVVTAVRALLHASGVLEQPLSQASSPSINGAGSSSALANEIRGNFSRQPLLPPVAQIELRPATRRVTSTLSKLALSVRAIWGLLETIPADQVLDHDDVIAASSGEPDDLAQRDQLRQHIISEWARARDTRYEVEAKLRSEVLASARDVQLVVVNFLNEFDRVVGSTMLNEDGSPLALVRAPKALVGSLRTNAAALLLPGGGFGGNWRGNGFVTLPSPHTTPNPSEGLSNAPPTLIYAYPSRSITAENAGAIRKDSNALSEQADALRKVVETLRGPEIASAEHDGENVTTPDAKSALAGPPPFVPPASPGELMNQAAQLQRRLAGFLNTIEDIDVASAVDFELVNNSRPASRLEDRFIASDAMSTQSDRESNHDGPSADYRASVLEARPLLADFEVGKQALYDIAPRLVCALQEIYMSSTDAICSSALGPHPSSSTPLAAYSPPTRTDKGVSTLLDILNDLTTGVNNLCVALVSLSAIAEIQSTAPVNLRQNHVAQRSSVAFGSSYDASASSSSLADSSARRHVGTITHSPASSRQSLAPEGSRQGAPSTHSRESVDSDFFFSGSNAGTATSASIKTRSSLKQLLANAGLRRSSIATNASDSQTLDAQRSIPSSPSKHSTPTTPSSKLAKLTGETNLPSSPQNRSVAESTPPWLGPDFGPDEVSFNMEGQVRGGTLRALIIAGTSHEGRVDSSYLSAFLMTYRTFCTAHELLDLLIDRYQVPVPEGLTPDELKIWQTRKFKPIRARVANLIKSWVREYMDYDERDIELLKRIAAFAANTMADPVQSPQIIKVVEERLSGQAPRPMGSLAPGPLPPSLVPRNFRKLKFMDIDPLELARQLTIMDGRLFAKITPQECLGKAWPKQFGSDAPNTSAMIDMSNAVTRWVTETILLQEDLKKRAAIVKHFILVAERCLSLNNFSTLIHIIAGLNSTPIHRLRRTWEQVSQKAMIQLGVLNNIMRPDKNYKEYREQLRKVAPPCVPFLGVYLTDWTFIGDGNPDMLRERPHQINFNKRQKASELILMIKLHQATSYNLAAVPALAKFIDEHLFPPHANPSTDDQHLYELSLLREPRERDDEKIARLLSESGFL